MPRKKKDVMSEFRKLQMETAGMSSILGKVHIHSPISPAINKEMLESLESMKNELVNVKTELQKTRKKLNFEKNEHEHFGRKLNRELVRVKAKQDIVNKNILEELQMIRDKMNRLNSSDEVSETEITPPVEHRKVEMIMKDVEKNNAKLKSELYSKINSIQSEIAKIKHNRKVLKPETVSIDQRTLETLLTATEKNGFKLNSIQKKFENEIDEMKMNQKVIQSKQRHVDSHLSALEKDFMKRESSDWNAEKDCEDFKENVLEEIESIRKNFQSELVPLKSSIRYLNMSTWETCYLFFKFAILEPLQKWWYGIEINVVSHFAQSRGKK